MDSRLDLPEFYAGENGFRENQKRAGLEAGPEATALFAHNERVLRRYIENLGFSWAKHVYQGNLAAPYNSHNPVWTTAADFTCTIDPAEYGIPTDGSWALYRIAPEGEAPAWRPAFAPVQRIAGTDALRLERNESIAAAGVLILVARPLLP